MADVVPVGAGVTTLVAVVACALAGLLVLVAPVADTGVPSEVTITGGGGGCTIDTEPPELTIGDPRADI